MNKIACPRCGGHLVVEEFGQYGMAHKISYNGKIQKRSTFNDYGGGDVMENEVYCPACKWSADKDFVSIDGDKIMLMQEGAGNE